MDVINFKHRNVKKKKKLLYFLKFYWQFNKPSYCSLTSPVYKTFLSDHTLQNYFPHSCLLLTQPIHSLVLRSTLLTIKRNINTPVAEAP